VRGDSWAALARIPGDVRQSRRFPLGVCRGLAFGIERHPGGTSEVYMEGAGIRTASLLRDSQGPRAVMNALHRLTDSYAAECGKLTHDLALAQTQLQAYQARLGNPFGHAAYADELTDLRDQLKSALSGNPQANGEQAVPTSTELADRIKALKAACSLDAETPRANAGKEEQGEEPIAARLRRRIGMEHPTADGNGTPSARFRDRLAAMSGVAAQDRVPG
jgi:hypothetical protein